MAGDHAGNQTAGAAALTRLWQTLQLAQGASDSAALEACAENRMGIRPAWRADRYRGGLPLIHSVNGFRLHQTAMHFEG
jgi:hypothetical protein